MTWVFYGHYENQFVAQGAQNHNSIVEAKL